MALLKLFWRDQRGAAALETAIAIPLLVMVTLFVVDTNRFLRQQEALEHGVNAGAYAITYDAEDYDEAISRVREASALEQSSVDIGAFCQCPGRAPTTCPADCNGNTVSDVFVTIEATHRFTPMVALPFLNEAEDFSATRVVKVR